MQVHIWIEPQLEHNLTFNYPKGLNRESLYKTLNGETSPTWVTMHRLMKALKIDVNFMTLAPVQVIG